MSVLGCSAVNTSIGAEQPLKGTEALLGMLRICYGVDFLQQTVVARSQVGYSKHREAKDLPKVTQIGRPPQLELKPGSPGSR